MPALFSFANFSTSYKVSLGITVILFRTGLVRDANIAQAPKR